VAMPSVTTQNNRLIVSVGVWGSAGAVNTVTDNAGDTFTKVGSVLASDQTELTIWTAVVATGGTKPTITATATKAADIGVTVTEYSGLSVLSGASAVDKTATATGTTSAAASVSSGATDPVANDGLALGFYADSGFGVTLNGDAGYATRVNMSPNGLMDMLVEDRLSGVGSMPAATASTGANTVWLMATIVFRRA
jgi:hypothetical protein